MIHVYYGDGKGKTTASVGLAVRASGQGMRILIVRFLKTDDSGEVSVLQNLKNITVYPCQRNFGFTFQMTEEQKREARKYYTKTFYEVTSGENISKYDMLIMDEINVACYYNFVDTKEVFNFLDHAKKKEVVLTGRYVSEEIIKRADYVTRFQKEKHPFDEGVSARRGIEY